MVRDDAGGRALLLGVLPGDGAPRVVLQVPVVRTSPVAFVYSASTPQNLGFADVSDLRAALNVSPGASSMEGGAILAEGGGNITHRWVGPVPGELEEASESFVIVPMFPGDTMRMTTILSLSTWPLTDGAVTVSYEFRTRLPIPAPEPSAALSLPIGVSGLAGLAAMRGGV